MVSVMCPVVLSFSSYMTILCYVAILYQSDRKKDEDQKFFNSDTFESDTIVVTFKRLTFEIFGKCSESVGFHDNNNDLQEDVKFFKSGTFGN